MTIDNIKYRVTTGIKRYRTELKQYVSMTLIIMNTTANYVLYNESKLKNNNNNQLTGDGSSKQEKKTKGTPLCLHHHLTQNQPNNEA